MLMAPGGIVQNWQRGIHSFGLVAVGILLLAVCVFGVPAAVLHTEASLANKSPNEISAPGQKVAGRSQSLLIFKMVALVTGVALIVWCVGGRFLHPTRLFANPIPPIPEPPAADIQRLVQDDGAKIHVETSGPISAPTVILTHGWSLNHHQWVWLRHEWGDRFRVVAWDIPGLGQSKPPTNHDFSLDNMARQLKAVVDASGPGPIVLVGHSIGGMIILTFCRLFPDLLGNRISKLVLVHTTYTNPVLTMASRGVLARLQKPLIEPLLHLQIALWPLVWCLNWLSLWNGSLHRAVAKTGFSENASRSELDYVASFYPLGSPAVLARGALAMLAYDATTILPEIQVPVLVVGGANDPITQVTASELMHQRLPHAQLTIYNPGKHFGFFEYHSEFARITGDFCAS